MGVPEKHRGRDGKASLAAKTMFLKPTFYQPARCGAAPIAVAWGKLHTWFLT